MTATEILKHEHQAILIVIAAAENEARAIAETGKMHVDKVRQMADFLTNFVDRCHHSKEEKHLFAAMHAHGMPMDSGPLAVMLREHEQGRVHVRAIAAAVGETGIPAGASARKVRDELFAYAALLRSHIDKEDNVLYPMADRLLTANEQNALTQAFERIESEEMGAGVHEKYHAWIQTLVQEQALSASGDGDGGEGSQSGETDPTERKE